MFAAGLVCDVPTSVPVADTDFPAAEVGEARAVSEEPDVAEEVVFEDELDEDDVGPPEM